MAASRPRMSSQRFLDMLQETLKGEPNKPGLPDEPPGTPAPSPAAPPQELPKGPRMPEPVAPPPPAPAPPDRTRPIDGPTNLPPTTPTTPSPPVAPRRTAQPRPTAPNGTVPIGGFNFQQMLVGSGRTPALAQFEAYDPLLRQQMGMSDFQKKLAAARQDRINALLQGRQFSPFFD